MGKKKTKRGPGRPPKPAGEAKDTLFQIRLSLAEREAIENASGGNMSLWARSVLLKAARKANKNAPE